MNRTWRRRRGVWRLALSGGLGPLVAPIAGGGAVATEADPLDLNTATAEPLKALPGIGDADAEQILKGRPAPRQDDLVQRKRLPPATSEQIKARLLATPPAGPRPPKGARTSSTLSAIRAPSRSRASRTAGGSSASTPPRGRPPASRAASTPAFPTRRLRGEASAPPATGTGATRSTW